MGSGTTGISAKLLDREFIGFEMEEESLDTLETLEFIYGTTTPDELKNIEVEFDDGSTRELKNNKWEEIDYNKNNPPSFGNTYTVFL